MSIVKRASVFLLALALLAALGAGAQASGNPERGTITYKTPNNGISVPSLYRLFDATLAFDDEGNATGIVYTCTDYQKSISGFDTYFSVGPGNTVTATDAALDESGYLTEAAVQWIRSNLDTLAERVVVYTKTYWDNNQARFPDVRDSVYSYWQSDSEVFGNVPFGYYYIDSRMGSVVMVTSTYPDAVVQEKNEIPGMTKTITGLTTADGETHDQDIDPATQQTATVQLGDTVQYTLTVTAHRGSEAFRLMDRQHDGLTLDPDSIQVKVNGETLAPENYTVYAAPNPQKLWTVTNSMTIGTDSYSSYDLYKGPKDGEGGTLLVSDLYRSRSYSNQSIPKADRWEKGTNLLIVFNQTFLDTIREDSEITVSYDCVVNDKAVVVNDRPLGQRAYATDNMALLHYGHDASLTSYAGVYSARIVLYKYAGDGDSSSSSGSVPLNGVKFVLKNSEGKYLKQGADRAVHWVSGISDATEFVTGGNTRIGTYYFPDYYGRQLVENGADPYYIYYYTNVSFVVRAGDDGQLDTNDDLLIIGGKQVSRGDDGKWGTGDEVITDNAGYLWIEGLTNGTYTLVETYALPGYNRAPDTTVVINNQENSYWELHRQVSIANKTGSVLPRTGGTGVTVFYVAGAVLLLGAGYMLLRKRRMDAV